jgi:preprotein translocase subunit SecA
MLQRFVKTFGGDPNKKEIEKTADIVEQINALEGDFEKLSDADLRARTDGFRARLASELEGIEEAEERRQIEQAVLDEILPEAFAIVREASKRTLGQRHYDVQLIGGLIMHQGKIAEMRTGEGKTLVATLPLYLNALTGRGVHLVTVNDYLARRDARWMGAIYAFLGLSVGILQMASATENGKKAFLYDPGREHTREDQDQMRLVDRVEAYAADITYGTNAEFGFDYLRDNMTMRLEDRVQRGHYFSIVDEVDNVLIDEARTPLIISGPASGDVEWYGKMAILVRQLRDDDYEVSEKDRSVTLTEIGTAHVEQLLGQPLRDPDRPEDVTPEQARLLGYLEQALRAQHLFKRNKDYLVQAGKVVIVDEFTGRLMPGRRWSDGLHQAVEAKEGVKVEPENVTYATITLQNYFRMYEKLAGMTGTALTEAEEFDEIYKLSVLSIPTNLEYQSFGSSAPLVEIKDKDEDGYDYAFFARKEDPQKEVVFWRRKDFPDVIFRTVEAKLRAMIREIVREHVLGRPLLVGTSSVESSERLSGRMRAEPVRRLMQVLLIRHTWMEANDRIEDGRAIPALELLNKPLDQLRPEELRPMAKELGLSLNPEEAANLTRLRSILHLGESDETRLKVVLQAGVPHEVLNARKHTEESQIIAGAGAFGAVTIATNMAGRGVDIKLGGEIAEEILSSVNRVLRKAGYADPYDMSLQDRRLALQKLDPSLYGIYDAEVKHFLQYFEDMERVRELGGLHVVGSERHDARRIDNQLRGRAARQGDPGSSRFYLSLEDDLMRMFGGDQVKNIMSRLNIDDDYPLQARMVSNMIEQSQTRVEGANFDVRKHLLEYDDVLNSQRMRIYGQRNRVFEKDDLTEDVDELLQTEIERRVGEAVASEEYWRLLAWLDQIQPPIQVGGKIFPSFTYKLLLDELSASSSGGKPAPLKESALDLAGRALEAGQNHFLNWALDQIDRAGEAVESQIDERVEALDTFLDAVNDRDETDTRRPQELGEELVNTVRIPLRLSNDQLLLLRDDPKELFSPLREQVEKIITSFSIARLAATVEFRFGEPLGFNSPELQALDWKEASTRIEDRLRAALEERRERLLGADGQIVREVNAFLERNPGDDEQIRLRLLMSMAQGSRASFDSKTHRQVRQVFIRLQYGFCMGELLDGHPEEALAEEIFEHLDKARAALSSTFQESEAGRLGLSTDSPQVGEAGRRIQNQIYRQVLLGAITELWVDYLTRVEALRVSIGLEAYAQRDPLVQYKGQASEMFQTLLTDIRAAVISRIFLYRPRTAAVTLEAETQDQVTGAGAKPESEPAQLSRSQKKRKRHRH